jgi:hypothetical protein
MWTPTLTKSGGGQNPATQTGLPPMPGCPECLKYSLDRLHSLSSKQLRSSIPYPRLLVVRESIKTNVTVDGQTHVIEHDLSVAVLPTA